MPDLGEDSRKELEAALAARKELGRDYEQALVESFVDKIDKQIGARVDAQVAARSRARGKGAKQAGEGQMVLGFVSLGTGIPITAIAGGIGELPGIVVAWLGIVGVNVAHAWSSRRES